MHASRLARLAGGLPRLASRAAMTVVLVAVGACAAHPSGSGGSTAGSATGASRPSPSPSVSAPPDAFTVQDRATGNHFEVVLTPGDPSFGQFIAAIPGVGLLQPNAAATVTVNANHTDTLTYSGAGSLDASAHLDAELGSDYRPSGHAVAATLTLRGTADPAHQTASLDLIVNGVDHHFGTATTSDATPAVTAVVTALNANNWTTLYGLSDLQTHTALTVQQYNALGSSCGTFSHVTTDGAITYTTSAADIHGATVKITATLTSPTGSSSTVHGLIEMIDSTEGWQVYSIIGPGTANSSAPVSTAPSPPAEPGSAFVTVTPIPTPAGPSTYDLPAGPTVALIAPLPLSAGPDEPATPGMRLSYSLDSAGFEPSTEVWLVTSVHSSADGTQVILQEQVGRTPGLNHVIEILPNNTLQFESFDVGFKDGGRLARTSGAIDVPAPSVFTPTPSTFVATYTQAGQSTQLTVSAQVEQLGAQRIVVPAGTYDADVIQEDDAYEMDGSRDEFYYTLYLAPGIGIVNEIEQWSTNGGRLQYIGTLALTSVTGGPAS